MNIYPAILADSIKLVQKQVEIAQSSPDISVVQLDVIDGIFADELTVTPTGLQEVDFGELKVDFHLMVQEPLDFVYEIQDVAGLLPIRSIISQIERMTSDREYLEVVKQNQWRVGFSLDLFTPLESFDFDLLEDVDVIQVMGNQAGRQGLSLHPQALITLQEVRKLVDDNELDIEVMFDIGVKTDTIKKIVEAGADGVAIGSGLWKAPDFNAAVQEFLLASSDS